MHSKYHLFSAPNRNPSVTYLSPHSWDAMRDRRQVLRVVPGLQFPLVLSPSRVLLPILRTLLRGDRVLRFDRLREPHADLVGAARRSRRCGGGKGSGGVYRDLRRLIPRETQEGKLQGGRAPRGVCVAPTSPKPRSPIYP